MADVATYLDDASYYGTFDQGGNVYEWTEAIVSSTQRTLRGGSWGSSGGDAGALMSSVRGLGLTTGESGEVGFRVTSLDPIPEASTYALLFGIASLAMVARRRL